MLGKLLQERYKIIQVLSAGEFYHTYLAQDTCQPGNPTCVVKHLIPSLNHLESLPTLRRLFNREVEALQKLGNYDRVPQLIAHFEQDQEFYLVQEFVEGYSLSAELKPRRVWSEQQVVQLLQEVLSILEVVHSHGLIHRDLKPSNLIRRQQDARLVLIEFGSVKQAWKQVVTAQGQTSASFAIDVPTRIDIGTPGYMPIEQERGRPRPNSDIYALGMIGIQALTGLHPGQIPEDARTRETIWQRQANVSPQLAGVINKMVHYHSQDRYQTATEVLQALQPLTNLHSPIQHSARANRPLTEQQASAQSSVSVMQNPVATLPNQEISNNTPAQKSTLLLGIATGFGCAVALMLGIYYFRLSPASAPSFFRQIVPSPLQNTPRGNNALAKTLTGHADTVWSVALSPDNQTIISGSGDKTIKIWNLGTSELRRTLSGHAATVWSIALSPDGQTIASGSSDNTIKLWNLDSGTLRWTLFGHSDAVRSIAFSPDGRILASGSLDKTIKIWNLSNGELMHTFSGLAFAIRSIVFSPEGQILASSGSNNTIKLWSLSSGELLRTLVGHTNRVLALALSPDGQFLTSGSVDKTIKVWNLSNGKLLRTLSGNSDWVNAVAISPDARSLASGIGKKIKIWDLRNGELLQTLSGDSEDVTSVAFSADGKRLVSGSRDKTIKIWQL